MVTLASMGLEYETLARMVLARYAIYSIVATQAISKLTQL
jgi:hypothetical protein